MASKVDLNNITEYQESAEDFTKKVDSLATLWREAKRVVFFTGAGVSTSAKIPDFRGPDGCWTAAAQGRAAPKSIALSQALPTVCHMAILTLMQQAGKDSYCVSQNIDGLHRRSGMRADEISELHGNTFKELCWSCGAEYLRPFEVHGASHRSCEECKRRVPHFCHCTPRLCVCGSRLKDSIIHFKESLPVDAVEKAFAWAEKADLCIVLGSSLTVAPACHVPRKIAEKGGKLVIVNLQKTPLDELASLRIFCKTDELMATLLDRLEIPSMAFDPLTDPVTHTPTTTDDAEFATAGWEERGLPGSQLVSCDATTLDADSDVGGYIVPKTNCPHLPASISVPSLQEARRLFEAGCSQCGPTKEIWLCCSCMKANCGRYVKGHALAHSAEGEEHPVAISLEDLNTWCYSCESYVVHDDITPLYVVLHVAKHGKLPAGCAATFAQ